LSCPRSIPRVTSGRISFWMCSAHSGLGQSRAWLEFIAMTMTLVSRGAPVHQAPRLTALDPTALALAAFHAELVAFRVGQRHPAGSVCLPVILDERGADAEQALDLLVAGPAGGEQVEVHPVLDHLGLGHRDEQQAEALAGDDPALGVIGLVRVARVFPPARYLAPELGLAVGVGAIDGDTANFEHTRPRNCDRMRARRRPERQPGMPVGGALSSVPDMAA